MMKKTLFSAIAIVALLLVVNYLPRTWGASNAIFSFNPPLMSSLGGTGTTNGSNAMYTNQNNVLTKAPSITPVSNAACTGTVTPDGVTSTIYECSLTGNVTIANPTTMTPGTDLTFLFFQPASGGPYTVNMGGTYYGYPAAISPPVLSTAAGEVDLLHCHIYYTTIILCDQLENNLQAIPSSTMAPPAGFNIGQLVHEDTFSGANLNLTNWVPFEQTAFQQFNSTGFKPGLVFPYSGYPCGNQPCANDAGGSFQQAGTDPYPYGCTGAISCSLIDIPHLIGGNTVTGLELALAPTTAGFWTGQSNGAITWASAAITSAMNGSEPYTTGTFTVPSLSAGQSAYVQFRAKMPDSRYGAQAVLQLFPAPETSNYGFHIQRSGWLNGGPDGPNAMLDSFWGSPSCTGTCEVAAENPLAADLTAAFHIYGVKIEPGVSLTVYFDGIQTAQYTNAIPTNTVWMVNIMNQMFTTDGGGFHTVPTSGQNGPFLTYVNDVQIYACITGTCP